MVLTPINFISKDERTLELYFSSSVTQFLTLDNFKIKTVSGNTADLELLSVSIDDNKVTLSTRPQSPGALYMLCLLDSEAQQFVDVDNNALTYSDELRNLYFVGIEQPNAIRESMVAAATTTYDLAFDTVAGQILTVFGKELLKAQASTGETQNNNFISVPVVDEFYVRGNGPSDRLKNENAYKIERVSRFQTNTTEAASIVLDPNVDGSVPFSIINLRATQATDAITSTSGPTRYEGYKIRVSNPKVIKFTSAYLDTYRANDVLEYKASKYGYALLNNRYDLLAKKYFALENNEILLSSLFGDSFLQPIQGDTLTVNYEFDDTGIKIDRNTIKVFAIKTKKIEVIEQNISTFILKNSPIVDADGDLARQGGVSFYKSSNDRSPHPAFVTEIQYRKDFLPDRPGQYSINYETGEVFVFGTLSEVGTGGAPPIVSYRYKLNGAENKDYYINEDGFELSFNPASDFIKNTIYVTYEYENTLREGVDYIASSHNEVINERINNNLVEDFKVRVKNSPVKEILEVKNETTGELYNPGYSNGNVIVFSGKKPPTTETVLAEAASFTAVNDEQLTHIASQENSSGHTIYEFALKNKRIFSLRNAGIAASFDTSLRLSDSNVFANERFFDPKLTVEQNIERLTSVGDYTVDYFNGVLYANVLNGQSIEAGSASYSYSLIDTNGKHVTAALSVYRGKTPSKRSITFESIEVFDDGVLLRDADKCYDMFDGITTIDQTDGIFLAQLQDDFTCYTAFPPVSVYGVYTQNDLDIYGGQNIASRNLFDPKFGSIDKNKIDLKKYVTAKATINGNVFNIVIPEQTNTVKSVVNLDTGKELLDAGLNIIKKRNIIIKNVVNNNNGTATLAISNQELAGLANIPSENFIVDIKSNSFELVSISGDVVVVNISNQLPEKSLFSSLTDKFGNVVYDALFITNVAHSGNNNYIVTYNTYPDFAKAGDYVVDNYNKRFKVIATDFDSSSLIVESASGAPSRDYGAKLCTTSLLAINGQNTTLTLPLDCPLADGQTVRVAYVSKSISDLILENNNTQSYGGTGLVINYSRGQYFVDYVHLRDEIIVSYEWGDNSIDFSASDALIPGEQYYVSYKFGASRDALESNFATLTNLPFLQNVPLLVDREVYRKAVHAALKAFIKGPTVEALKIIAREFSDLEPIVIESIVNSWIVGKDILKPSYPLSRKPLVFANGAYGAGVLVERDDAILLPAESSIRLNEGTFSTRIRSLWNGNEADGKIEIELPVSDKTIYYNGTGLPHNVESNRWTLNTDSIGTAFSSNELSIHNAKNLPLKTLGKYTWYRNEPGISPLNNMSISLNARSLLVSADPSVTFAEVYGVRVDDGHTKYGCGCYLGKIGTYSHVITEQESHLTTEPPFPHIEQTDPADRPGEAHLNDHLGTRKPGSRDLRSGGWDRQLYVKITINAQLFDFESWFVFDSEPIEPADVNGPLDQLLFPGIDVFVDALGVVWEIYLIDANSSTVWLKTPSAAGIAAPSGTLTLYRKALGISNPNGTISTTKFNWSDYSNIEFKKVGNQLSLQAPGEQEILSSYSNNALNNSSGTPNVVFGVLSDQTESKSSLKTINYTIHPIFKLSDIYLFSSGRHPDTSSITVGFDRQREGAPYLNATKYIAIYTDQLSVAANELKEQIFIKVKTPAYASFYDGENEVTIPASPVVQLNISSRDEIFNISTSNGADYKKKNNTFTFTCVDSSAPILVPHSVAQQTLCPTVKASAAKRHYIFDVVTEKGQMALYREKNGLLTASVLAGGNLYNVSTDISDWLAGQLHHVGMSWKIGTANKMDELHLFVDGVEAPSVNIFPFVAGDIMRATEISLDIVEPTYVLAEIVNNGQVSGLLIDSTSEIDSSWIGRSIVLQNEDFVVTPYTNTPLQIASVISYQNIGKLVTLSSNEALIDFSYYGPLMPMLYSPVTHAMSPISTVRTNIGIFVNSVKLNNESHGNPQFRIINNIIEFYSIDDNGLLIAVCSTTDSVTLKTFGLLNNKIKDYFYKYGSLLDHNPITIEQIVGHQVVSDNINISNTNSLFMTDLPPPISLDDVKITKVIVPKVFI